jgi:hypothetical protein
MLTREILAFIAEGGHLWPDADESKRTAVGAVIADRLASLDSAAY